eukprot:Sspe_Gene.55046::Locus_30318_Transcript_1_1_Confidence_1.000_Length_938::g.55046::m.55046/K04507/CACYBP, SIP; calcyclin binding protein
MAEEEASVLAVLEEEIAELRSLQDVAKLPGVHKVLRCALEEKSARAEQLRKKTAAAEKKNDVEEKKEVAEDSIPDTPNGEALRMLREDDAAGHVFHELRGYAWDQSDKFVKIYCDLPGVGATRSYCHFAPSSFTFRSVNSTGVKHHALSVHSLYDKIRVNDCSLLVKPDKFVIRLAKRTPGESWESLDDSEKRRKEEHRKLADSGATTEELLANIYRNADDKTRASLAEAAHQGRLKREAEAKKRGL